MHVSFKITTWEFVDVPDKLKDEALKKIKSGEIANSDDLITLCDTVKNTYRSRVDGSDEMMSVKENDNQSTIEVEEDGEDGSVMVYQNGE